MAMIKLSGDNNIPSTRIDVMPTRIDVMPMHIDVVPTHIDVVPTYIDVMPMHIDVVPTYIYIVPMHIDVVPMYIDIMPTRIKKIAGTYYNTTSTISNLQIFKSSNLQIFFGFRRIPKRICVFSKNRITFAADYCWFKSLNFQIFKFSNYLIICTKNFLSHHP
jgi:hypothetical protein